MTGQERRARIVELGETILDMGQRIVASGGEPNYADEKAWRAACSAMRVLAVADPAQDVDELLLGLRGAYKQEASS